MSKPFGTLMDDLDSGTSSAVRAFVEERVRQKTVEKWTTEHDDQHREDEMALAAACYALPRGRRADTPGLTGRPFLSFFWPWSWQWWKPSPADRKREIVKAGALLLAEYERLERLEKPAPYFDATDPTIPLEP